MKARVYCRGSHVVILGLRFKYLELGSNNANNVMWLVQGAVVVHNQSCMQFELRACLHNDISFYHSGMCKRFRGSALSSVVVPPDRPALSC